MKRILIAFGVLIVFLLSSCGVRAPIPEIGFNLSAPTTSVRSVTPGHNVSSDPNAQLAAIVPGLIGASESEPIEIGQTWQDLWLSLPITKTVKDVFRIGNVRYVSYTGEHEAEPSAFNFELTLNTDDDSFIFEQNVFYGLSYINPDESVFDNAYLSRTTFDGLLEGNFFSGTGVLRVFEIYQSGDNDGLASVIEANISVSRNDVESRLEVAISDFRQSSDFTWVYPNVTIDDWDTVWAAYFSNVPAPETGASVTYVLPDGGVWTQL